MTITAWVKVRAWNRDWQAIVAKGDSSWRLSRYSNTGLVSFESTDSIGHRSLPSSVSIDDGTWHHVTGVYVNGIKYLYLDGRLEATDGLRSNPINSNSSPVMIGENDEARGRFFDGNIDDVAFFRRGLSFRGSPGTLRCRKRPAAVLQRLGESRRCAPAVAQWLHHVRRRI